MGTGGFCYRLITDEQCLQVTQPGPPLPPDFMFPSLLDVTQTQGLFRAVFTAQEAEAMLSARMQVTGMDGCVEVNIRLRGGDLLSHQLPPAQVPGEWEEM